MSGRRYLTLKEFSTHTGLSEATVRRRAREGKIPFRQPGGPRTKLLFQADALEHIGGAHTPPPPVVDPAPPIPGPPPRWRGQARQGKN